MSAAEILALVVGLGGLVGALVSLYNSVTKGQLDKVAQDAKEKQDDAKLEADERKASQDAENARFDRELGLLRAENSRMATALTDVRAENDRMFLVQVELRKALNARDEELFKLRQDLVLEKARTSELERRVDTLTAERDGYVALLKQAGLLPPAVG